MVLAKLPDELEPYKEEIFRLIDGVFDENKLKDTMSNGRGITTNPRNDNFNKKEFQTLWNKINKKAIYTVHYDSDELIKNCILKLDDELKVKVLTYKIQKGEMDEMKQEKLKMGNNFTQTSSESKSARLVMKSRIKYDLIGKISQNTKLTRITVGKILKDISSETFNEYKLNPEDFISIASRLMNEQKATTLIEHLTYDSLNDTHNIEDIFTISQENINLKNAKKVNKHIYDYIATDSKIEKDFVSELDVDDGKVVVYAKLPKSFFIPTPVGNYNPDFAITFNKESVKHIYFIAETKGSMSSMELRKTEEVKIKCAEKFFETISNNEVIYKKINGYDELMSIVNCNPNFITN